MTSSLLCVPLSQIYPTLISPSEFSSPLPLNMNRSSNAARILTQAHRILIRSAQLRQRRQFLSYSQSQLARFPPYNATLLSPSLVRILQTNTPSRAFQLLCEKKVEPSPEPTKEPPEKKSTEEGQSATKQDGSNVSSGTETPDGKSKEGGGRAAEPASGGSGGNNEENNNSSWLAQAALALFVMFGLSVLGSRDSGREISFHSFVWDLLQPGHVDRIEVINRNVARIYLKTSANGSLGGVRSQTSSTDNFDPDEQSMNDWENHDPHDNDNYYNLKDSPRNGSSRPPSLPKLPPTRGPVSPTDSPYYFNIGSVDTFERKLEAIQEDLGIEPEDFIPVVYNKETSLSSELLRQIPSILLLGLGILFLRNALGQIGGMSGGRSGIFQVGKANPTVVKGDAGAGTTTFASVAGLDEAKQEVMEFVDFLKNANRYESLGAKIPKGALLVGPPGTGKTLLAKATAGEANVPFFSMSGSDFIEMFVGVGPSRVRDLFAQARSSAPCIVFIDEIDAIGKARGRGGMAGGNDERENTLNALLVEMDGFSSTSGVVVLAGTNRADVLDRALLRPGRFDRQISIDKPDMRGRFQIFMVHLKPLKLQDESSTVAKRLAALTPGFAGADIANICNEAALIAARGDKNAVEMIDFEQATDRVIGGLEKKNKVISRKDREIVAHHEAGHAVAGWFLRHADPLIKVSIIPRGSAALGFAQYLPNDKFLQSRDQLRDFMIMALGGRVSEQLCFGSITTGAQDDLKRVTRAVYAQITNFGMSEKVGKVYFPRAGESGNQFYKPYSERTAELIDDEAMSMVDEAYLECERLLTEKLDVVKGLAARLLEKEVIGEEDLVDVMGERPYKKPVTYDDYVGRFEKDRRERRGDKGRDGDGHARDGSMTPPIPTAEGAADGKQQGLKQGDRGGGGGDRGDEHFPIPELA